MKRHSITSQKNGSFKNAGVKQPVLPVHISSWFGLLLQGVMACSSVSHFELRWTILHVTSSRISGYWHRSLFAWSLNSLRRYALRCISSIWLYSTQTTNSTVSCKLTVLKQYTREVQRNTYRMIQTANWRVQKQRNRHTEKQEVNMALVTLMLIWRHTVMDEVKRAAT